MIEKLVNELSYIKYNAYSSKYPVSLVKFEFWILTKFQPGPPEITITNIYYDITWMISHQ